MNILRATAEYLGICESADARAARLGTEREKITTKVQELLCRHGAEAISSSDAICGRKAEILGDLLSNLSVHMRCVEKRGDFPHHYYLMTKDGLIVDGTWQQFLRPFCPPQYSCIRPPLPDHLPKVFIGTRKELVDLVDGNAQRKFTANGKEISAEEFVDMQYGLGKHAHESHEVGLRFR